MHKKEVGLAPLILGLLLILISACTAGSKEDNDLKPQLAIDTDGSTSIATEPSSHSFLLSTQSLVLSQPSVEPFPADPDLDESEIQNVQPSPVVLVDVVEKEGWIWHDPGEPVLAPVLLYHHIGYDETNNPYYLTPELFAGQLDWIAAQGYTTITPTLLAEALRSGAFLPSLPILITFDDGPADLFTNAFPGMQMRNMVGTAYLVGDSINQNGSIRAEDVWAMYAAGWEFGSHSMTHADLTGPADIETEMLNSGKYLQLALNIPIETFAYPYGAGEPGLFQRCREFAYVACMGIGDIVIHHDWALYYLSRLEVHNGMTADDLAQMIAEAEIRSGTD